MDTERGLCYEKPEVAHNQLPVSKELTVLLRLYRAHIRSDLITTVLCMGRRVIHT